MVFGCRREWSVGAHEGLFQTLSCDCLRKVTAAFFTLVWLLLPLEDGVQSANTVRPEYLLLSPLLRGKC